MNNSRGEKLKEKRESHLKHSCNPFYKSQLLNNSLLQAPIVFLCLFFILDFARINDQYNWYTVCSMFSEMHECIYLFFVYYILYTIDLNSIHKRHYYCHLYYLKFILY